MNKLITSIFTVVFFLCMLPNSSLALTIHNDTEDDVLIQFTFKSVKFPYHRKTQDLHLHANHNLNVSLHRPAFFCIPAKVKDKHVTIPGFERVKVQADDTLNVSNITKGESPTSVPKGYIQIINDTEEELSFTHSFCKNLHFPSKHKSFILRPNESRLIRKSGVYSHYFRVDRDACAFHYLNHSLRKWKASEFMHVPLSHFRLINDSEETRTFIHRYTLGNHREIDSFQLIPGEQKVFPLYALKGSQAVPKKESTIQLEGEARQDLKKGDSWSASELELK